VWAAIEPAQAAALLHDAWRRELVQIRQRSSDILRSLQAKSSTSSVPLV